MFKTYTFWAILLYAGYLALSIFPVTGIFLMFGMAMMGPYLHGLLPQIIIAALLLDITCKLLPRFLLIIPVVLYGSYYFLYFSEQRTLQKTGVELRAFNTQEIPSYDSAVHDLVLAEGYYPTRYKIPVVYSPNENFPQKYLSSRLIPQRQCVDLKNVGLIDNNENFIHCFGTHWQEDDQKYRRRLNDVSRLSMPAAPTKKIIKVEQEEVKSEKENKKFKRDYGSIEFLAGGFTNAEPKISITKFTFPDGGIREFKTAILPALIPFPFLNVGCGLISSSATWQCFAGFNRENIAIDTFPEGTNHELYGKNIIGVALKIPEYDRSELDSFAGYPENTALIESMITQKKNETPADLDEWGLRKDSPYQPKISTKNNLPSFEGEIHIHEKGGPFYSFIKKNEGRMVYLNIDAKPNAGFDSFQNYGVCKAGQPGCSHRTDNSYQFKNKDGSSHYFKEKGKFKGFFLIGKEELLENEPNQEDNDTITKLTVMSSDELPTGERK